VILGYYTKSGTYKLGVAIIDDKMLQILIDNIDKVIGAQLIDNSIITSNNIVINSTNCFHSSKNGNTIDRAKLFRALESNEYNNVCNIADTIEITLIELVKNLNTIDKLNKLNRDEAIKYEINTLLNESGLISIVPILKKECRCLFIKIEGHKLIIENRKVRYRLLDELTKNQLCIKEALLNSLKNYMTEDEIKLTDKLIGYADDRRVHNALNQFKKNQVFDIRNKKDYYTSCKDDVTVNLIKLSEHIKSVINDASTWIVSWYTKSITDRTVVLGYRINTILGNREDAYKLIIGMKKSLIQRVKGTMNYLIESGEYKLAPLKFYEIKSIKFTIDYIFLIELRLKISDMDKEVYVLDTLEHT